MTTTLFEREDSAEILGDFVDAAEAEIRDQPPEAVAVYEQYIDKKFGIERSDVEPLMLLSARYIVAKAFISAWHRLHGDEEKAADAATSACSMLNLFDVAPNISGGVVVLRQVMTYEQMWRGALQEAGFGRRSSPTVAVVFLMIAAATLLAWLIR